MINLNEVAVFIRVIEAGSFSGAARLLGLPRSTVSRKVSQLEESLGIRLLQRSTRKLNLTQAGREYYLKCSSAISEIEHANQHVTETQQTPSGVLRIAAPLGSQTGLISEWITEFLSLHQKVSGDIRLSDDTVNLIEDGIDIAFRAGQLKDSSLVARKLGNTRLVLCASPSYLQQSAALKSPKDLKHHPAIVFGPAQEQTTWRLQSSKGNATVQVHGKLMVNSMTFALQACLVGLGVALLPSAMVGEYVRSTQLEILLEDYSSDVGGLYVVYPSKTHLSVTVRAFLDFVIDKASEGLHWDREPFGRKPNSSQENK